MELLLLGLRGFEVAAPKLCAAVRAAAGAAGAAPAPAATGLLFVAAAFTTLGGCADGGECAVLAFIKGTAAPLGDTLVGDRRPSSCDSSTAVVLHAMVRDHSSPSTAGRYTMHAVIFPELTCLSS